MVLLKKKNPEFWHTASSKRFNQGIRNLNNNSNNNNDSKSWVL